MDNEEELVNLFDDGDGQPSRAAPSTGVDDLEDSISFNMPSKFEGKTKEEIAQAYTNLEKENGRRSNEVGELRKLTDDILRKQVTQSNSADEFINESTYDEPDFFDDPDAAVQKALADNPRLKMLEDRMMKDVQKNAHAELIASHSDADEVVASPEFNHWIQGSSGRLKMLQDAHVNHDVALAGDLLDMYKATGGGVDDKARARRDANASAELKSASMERGRPSVNSKSVYRRADLIRLKIEDPQRWDAMSKEIRQAYADGRVK